MVQTHATRPTFLFCSETSQRNLKSSSCGGHLTERLTSPLKRGKEVEIDRTETFRHFPQPEVFPSTKRSNHQNVTPINAKNSGFNRKAHLSKSQVQVRRYKYKYKGDHHFMVLGTLTVHPTPSGHHKPHITRHRGHPLTKGHSSPFCSTDVHCGAHSTP